MSNENLRRQGPGDIGLNLAKWAAGIAASVLGGVVLWWVTSTFLEPQKADIKIFELAGPSFVILAAETSEWVEFNIVTYNEGNVSAEDCNIELVPLDVLNMPIRTPNPIGALGSAGRSSTFGVEPGGKYATKVGFWLFESDFTGVTSTYTMRVGVRAKLACRNATPTSKSSQVNVMVSR